MEKVIDRNIIAAMTRQVGDRLRGLGAGSVSRSAFSGLLHLAVCLLPSGLLAVTAAPTLTPTPSASPGLPDIRPILPPEQYFIQTNATPLIVALVSLLLAGLVAWYLLRRPKTPPPTGPRLTAREAARQKLAELERRMDTLDARTFGGEVCDVLRVYLGDEYRMQPERQTSPEFLASVAASRVFSRNEHTLLSEFLDGCDLLKFARLDATPAGKRALLAQAHEFIDGSQREPEQPPALPLPLPPHPPVPPPRPMAEKLQTGNS